MDFEHISESDLVETSPLPLTQEEIYFIETTDRLKLLKRRLKKF